MASYARRLLVKNNINTDYIVSARDRAQAKDDKLLAGHLFRSIDPGFVERVEEGDFLIAGNNFGCGSSCEQAALALKASGIKAVIARSFSRIFYRSAFNVGLSLIECETNYIDDMDEIEVDLEKNRLRNHSKCVDIDINPTPPIMRKFIERGGIVKCFKETGDLEKLL